MNCCFDLQLRKSRAPFDGNRATAQVIINTVTEIGLENILGKHRAFINFTDELLIDCTARLLPPNKVVLEVLEDAVVNDGLVESLTQIVDAGYELAQDDFVYSPQWDRLMALASIIKIDVNALGREEIAKQVEHCKAFNVKLLAEKVETQEQFDELFELGFDLFQGFFFAKPESHFPGTNTPKSYEHSSSSGRAPRCGRYRTGNRTFGIRGPSAQFQIAALP